MRPSVYTFGWYTFDKNSIYGCSNGYISLDFLYPKSIWSKNMPFYQAVCSGPSIKAYQFIYSASYGAAYIPSRELAKIILSAVTLF